jgi:hypothetical protein
MSEAANAAERTMTLYKFTNKAESPHLDALLTMFYEGAFRNHVGIMEAWSLEDEEEHLILVGVELDEDGKPNCFPIAKCIRAEDVTNYLAPDGKGGYFDPSNPTELAAAKEDMKSYNDAIVED